MCIPKTSRIVNGRPLAKSINIWQKTKDSTACSCRHNNLLHTKCPSHPWFSDPGCTPGFPSRVGNIPLSLLHHKTIPTWIPTSRLPLSSVNTVMAQPAVKENSGMSDYISGGSNTNDTGFIILDCYLLICNYHQETSNQRRTREKRKAKKSKTRKSSGDNIVTQVPALVIPLLSKTVLAIGKPCFSPQEPSNIYHDHPLVGRHQVHYARVTLITAPGIHRSSSQCIIPGLGTT